TTLGPPRRAQPEPGSRHALELLDLPSAEGALQFLEEALVGPVRLVRRMPLELLEQSPLLVCEPPRHDDVDEHAVIAAAEALQHRHPASREDAEFARLRARRKLELDRAGERVGLKRRAERGLGNRQVDRGEYVVALAHEAGVRLHAHTNVDVACTAARVPGVPFARDADLLSVVNAGRDLHFQPALLEHTARAVTLRARCVDDPAGAAATRAGLGPDERAG